MNAITEASAPILATPSDCTAIALRVEDVGKTYTLESNELRVLDNINLNIKEGEFISIVGASGCGKSTLLRLIGGLDIDHDGAIVYQGSTVKGPSLECGIVFQEHRLFPWMTVEQNIALAFEATSVPNAERRTRVAEQIRTVGLTGFEGAYPHQISGGMSQRVAIARALVLRPKLLLLDEPFGALDALTRLKLQQELQRLWENESLTTILVTHDVEEAVFLGDRIVVMNARPGTIRRIVQVPIARPRTRSSTAFQAIKEDVLSDFSDDRHD
ncbi:ABC transporter ATP-binding protein [Janthinobacterium sp. 17J80-10]|uniref:ABC transporter ATP-binding protein n=1 Tax=Janthinobacterium sp. 17J80-10 TaxID=2497863 RepID=UPI0010059DBA|nr:ABC transporter ATP-binding protein [Janthinobacterium sp. 17J80-10]QAU33974.1 ABC transporter ATP-binding protein [Janthinobacterium sp. 17J80-10]